MKEKELQVIEEIIVACARRGMDLLMPTDDSLQQAHDEGFEEGIRYMRREVLISLTLGSEKTKG